MNARIETAIVEKLRGLSPQRLAEVEDFIDFVRAREEAARDAAAERLGEAFAKLEQLDQAPMSMDEVQAEVDAVRRERRKRPVADRS